MVGQVAQANDAQTALVGYGASVTLLDGQTVAAPAFGDVAIASVPMNLAYLLTLTRHFGQPGTFATGDLNGDGTVSRLSHAKPMAIAALGVRPRLPLGVTPEYSSPRAYA